MFNLLKKLIKKESKKINEDAIKNRHSPEENPKDFVNEKSNTHDGSNVTTIESETEIFNKGSICASQDEKVICEKPSDLNSGNVKKPIMEIKLEDEIRECFRKDYIEDETFLELFPIEIRPLIHKGILSCYESSLSARANENCQENTSRIFSWLYSLYADLWLHEYGYAEKLALKQHQLCYFDEYGDYCMDEWHKELSTFINKRKLNFERYIREKIPLKYQQYAKDTDNDFHIFPEKDDDLFTIEDHMTDGITLSSVFGYYTERLNNQNSEIDLDLINDPYEYEKAISNKFSALDWDSYPTSGSGDQGADVIAKKGDYVLVIQCKLYSSSIGNKAVQEVAAAKGYYNGNIAVVISNNEYTKSAKQLADSLSVILLHHHQIDSFDSMLFNEDD